MNGVGQQTHNVMSISLESLLYYLVEQLREPRLVCDDADFLFIGPLLYFHQMTSY